ncbi:MAG TPA: amylo-alpha-1,6-glucosidase [Woeseiaceae bacterium]|nr:amylo-alpha-1,6-glucosidase [Woeseiaceae bacterium]
MPARYRDLPLPVGDERLASEWLEADGLGGFASGTVSGIRTRRYHALLLAASRPPGGRIVLVNGMEAWLETPSGRFALSSQRYTPDTVYPDGRKRLLDFCPEPWPQWTFGAEDGTVVLHEVCAIHGVPGVSLRWRLRKGGPARLVLRPLLSGRDYHALHHENESFDFVPAISGTRLTWRPYPDVPAISIEANGAYRHEPLWYRNFLYEAERERGLDHVEDLASPGCFEFDLDAGDAAVNLQAGDVAGCAVPDPGRPLRGQFEGEAARRSRFGSPLERAASAYIVRRGRGKSVIAGYPWFMDWGRDTFIALRGFMTLPGGLGTAREVLLAWAGQDSGGLLPNRFPDAGEEPEFNAADASLWYVIAVYDYLRLARGASRPAASERSILLSTVERILAAFRSGTRFGIRMDQDGLLAAGIPGSQLTWMDARVDGRPVTPRIGKPVEIEALWLNALLIGRALSSEWGDVYALAAASFRARFWNGERGCLFDVVDVNHVSGENDGSFRPNQIFAIGGLPFQLLAGPEAARVVEAVEERLLTPLGLRSLAPGEAGYRAHYRGGVRERDSAYHQGTVWPWLIGPFVEAWLRVHGTRAEVKLEADRRFLAPLREHLAVAGLGHISEVADAEPPHRPGGCPFQAWSLGEFLRASRLVAAPR